MWATSCHLHLFRLRSDHSVASHITRVRPMFSQDTAWSCHDLEPPLCPPSLSSPEPCSLRASALTWSRCWLPLSGRLFPQMVTQSLSPHFLPLYYLFTGWISILKLERKLLPLTGLLSRGPLAPLPGTVSAPGTQMAPQKALFHQRPFCVSLLRVCGGKWLQDQESKTGNQWM